MRPDGKTTKQKATSLTLNKLSVVKKPAHQGALATIIKEAAVSEEQVDKETFAETFNQIMIEDQAAELFNTIWDMTMALRKSIRKTVENIAITNKKQVIQTNITDFATALSGVITATSIIKQGGQEMSKELTQEQVDQMVKEAVQPYKDKLGIAEELAKMDDATTAHYNGLGDDDKATFLKMSDDVRKTVVDNAVKKAAADDETFEADGNTIRKSDVGADVFQMLKNSHAKAENAEKIAKEEQEKREVQEFTKQAETDYPNLPGTPEVKGSILKAIAGMAKEVGDGLTAMLKAGNEGIADGKLFKEAGQGGTPTTGSPEAELDKLAKEEAAKTNTTFAKAYSAVLGTERGNELYQETLAK